VCILRTHVREEKAAAMLLRIGVHRCVHPRRVGGRSWPETDSSWTHQYYSVQARYTPKGTMEKGGHTRSAEKLHKRNRKRNVHRWLPPSHEQTAGREFTTKKKDSSRKRKKGGGERERERERDGKGFLLFRAQRCLIRLTAKQPRRGLIKKGMN